MYFHSSLKSEKTTAGERGCLNCFINPQVCLIFRHLLFVCSFILFLIVLLPGSIVIKHLRFYQEGNFFFPYCESVWSMVYLVPGCCTHSCIFCTSILSSMFSSLQLLVATESGQDQLLPESTILYYLVSSVNHHDDVPRCFHPKLFLSFICLRHGLPVDLLFPVLMPVTCKNILIQHAVTVVFIDHI